MTATDLIASGYRMAKGMVHRFTDGLTSDEFRHQPVPGANSAAWVVGHLALTLRKTAERLGATDLPPLPAGLAERFQQTGKSAADQSDLGDPAELVALFDTYIDRVAEAVKSLPAEALIAPPANRAGLALNAGEGLLFGSLHIAMHTGQLTTIRRSLGKPPVV